MSCFSSRQFNDIRSAVASWLQLRCCAIPKPQLPFQTAILYNLNSFWGDLTLSLLTKCRKLKKSREAGEVIIQPTWPATTGAGGQVYSNSTNSPPVRVHECWVHSQRVQVQVQIQKTREEEVGELTSSRLVSGLWLWWKTQWSRVHFLLWVCCQGGRCACAHLCTCVCEGQSKCKAPHVYQPLKHLLKSEFWVLSLMCLCTTHRKY